MKKTRLQTFNLSRFRRLRHRRPRWGSVRETYEAEVCREPVTQERFLRHPPRMRLRPLRPSPPEKLWQRRIGQHVPEPLPLSHSSVVKTHRGPHCHNAGLMPAGPRPQDLSLAHPPSATIAVSNPGGMGIGRNYGWQSDRQARPGPRKQWQICDGGPKTEATCTRHVTPLVFRLGCGNGQELIARQGTMANPSRGGRKSAPSNSQKEETLIADNTLATRSEGDVAQHLHTSKRKDCRVPGLARCSTHHPLADAYEHRKRKLW